MILIYHNPKCRKSRECLALIKNSNVEYEVIKYLEKPFSANELIEIIKKLNIKPIELIRQKESIWVEKYKSKQLSDNEIINAMVENPILIERPIVVNGNKAKIARPLENINEII